MVQSLPLKIGHPVKWFTPAVFEQYVCYTPVAQSSAILINVYIKAYHVTHKHIYLDKAEALANGLLAAQSWIEDTYNGGGEIPTWEEKMKPSNWLNVSYNAAEAILNLTKY